MEQHGVVDQLAATGELGLDAAAVCGGEAALRDQQIPEPLAVAAARDVELGDQRLRGSSWTAAWSCTPRGSSPPFGSPPLTGSPPLSRLTFARKVDERRDEHAERDRIRRIATFADGDIELMEGAPRELAALAGRARHRRGTTA